MLTDNGSQFTSTRKREVSVETSESVGHEATKSVKCNAFDDICEKHNIEHRLTLPYHRWINGQVESMNRTIEEVTVTKYYYKTHDNLKQHIRAVIDTCNFTKRLVALKGLAVLDLVNRCCVNEPVRFKHEPGHILPVTLQATKHFGLTHCLQSFQPNPRRKNYTKFLPSKV